MAVQEPDIFFVKSAAEGNTDSFMELAARYYTPMVAIAHSITGDRDLAEDAAQQCFARAAVKLSQLKDYGKFAGWLAAICRNEAKNIGYHMISPLMPMIVMPALRASLIRPLA